MSDATPPTAAAAGTSAKLFVRQSSGLVRNVSVTNALFFNVAAFVGVGLTLYPIFYSLGFVPVWKFGPLSNWTQSAGLQLRPSQCVPVGQSPGASGGSPPWSGWTQTPARCAHARSAFVGPPSTGRAPASGGGGVSG